jgi:hypothetical protein
MRQFLNIAAFSLGFLLAVSVGISHATATYCVDTSNGKSVQTDLELLSSSSLTRTSSTPSGWYKPSPGKLYYYAETSYYVYDSDGVSDLYTCADLGYDPVAVAPDYTGGNRIQDDDEDGIDCGGDTGVDCVSYCPDGYVLMSDGSTCCKQAPSMTIDGVVYDDMIYPWQVADPILASPDIDSSTLIWTEGSELSGLSSPDYSDTVDDSSYTTEYRGGGDYVVLDSDGNIVTARITGESTDYDNGDGTTTTITDTTTYNSETGQSQTVTETVVTDSSGSVISQSTGVTGTSGTTSGTTELISVGLGSDSGVTGDQYARGTDLIGSKIDDLMDAVEGEDDNGDPVVFSSPSESAYDYPADDESEYDADSLIDSYISQYSDFGWLPLFTDSQVITSDQSCSIDGSITLLSREIPLSLSMCEFGEHFESLGIILAVICQFYALIIAFGGID